jgi:hypothetical protein
MKHLEAEEHAADYNKDLLMSWKPSLCALSGTPDQPATVFVRFLVGVEGILPASPSHCGHRRMPFLESCRYTPPDSTHKPTTLPRFRWLRSAQSSGIWVHSIVQLKF